MSILNDVIRVWVSRLAEAISLPSDSDEEKLGKAVLLLIVMLGILVGLSLGVAYMLLRIPLAASFPLGFSLLSSVNIFLLIRTKRFGVFRFISLLLILMVPTATHWALGGFAASSAVILWSIFSPIGAMLFSHRRQATPWFIALMVILLVSAAFDPRLMQHAASLPPAAVVIFYLANLGGVFFVVYLVLQYFVGESDRAHQRSERLLLNVLPPSIALRLKRNPGTIADHFDTASVLFADIVDFTPLSAELSPAEMVDLLNEVFSHIDSMVAKYDLEKIRTIGDNYMAASGVPHPRSDHAHAISRLGLDIRDYIEALPPHNGTKLNFRVGINSGPVVGGIIGQHKFHYDIWGDTVNIASRMESQGVSGKVQLTSITYDLIKDAFICSPRGTIRIKGKGEMETWFLERPR
ncbi:MAG: adenylate/guanylate cyclase domain-containing protein [Chloroflexi bacterium]|nr:adenylate/guanylate cyclase domain-containing protein [Chloroflexota bacterium]